MLPTGLSGEPQSLRGLNRADAVAKSEIPDVSLRALKFAGCESKLMEPVHVLWRRRTVTHIRDEPKRAESRFGSIEGSLALKALGIQLWCWNYTPEPTAMGPIATLWARMMLEQGHDVSVVTAHPHYPPLWGSSARPYREVRDGVPVLRLPIWAGHRRVAARIHEEATYAAAAAAALALLKPPEVYVVVSPSFAALAPMIVNRRLRRRPWVLWLQDLLPDAATTTGLLREGRAVSLARRLERAAYRSADRIVVISDTFRAALLRKGVPPEKLTRIYNPATRGFAKRPRTPSNELRVLSLGNIGYSQGLDRLIRAFERSQVRGRLVILGTGEQAATLANEVRSDRVEIRGLVEAAEVDRELAQADLALIGQRPDVSEFNVPSRIMTLMARGIPLVAAVRPDSEVRRIVEEAGAGWTFDAARPEDLPKVLTEAAAAPSQVEQRSAAALRYAQEHFAPDRFVTAFEQVLAGVKMRL